MKGWKKYLQEWKISITHIAVKGLKNSSKSMRKRQANLLRNDKGNARQVTT